VHDVLAALGHRAGLRGSRRLGTTVSTILEHGYVFVSYGASYPAQMREHNPAYTMRRQPQSTATA